MGDAEEFHTVTIRAGRGGWGGPLRITPTRDRPLIYSVTQGGIHPVAARIAELSGGRAHDGFVTSAPLDSVAVAVIDCAGTARAGLYPMRRVPTVDVHAAAPSGPLASHMTADLFVSGVTPESVRR